LERRSPDVVDRLQDFRAAAQAGIKQSLMIAAGELGVAEVEGGVAAALDEVRAVLDLVRTEADPIAHTGILGPYSSILVAAGRYEEGLRVAAALKSVAESYGVEFPIGYAQLSSVSACIGLRRFTLAARTLSMLEREAQNDQGSYIRQNLLVQRARLYASVKDLRRALDVLALGAFEGSSTGGRAEFIGWQALISAAIGDSAGATALATDARDESRDQVANSLSHVAEALVTLNDAQHSETIKHLQEAIETGIWDPLVIAVRAAPRLGAFLADQPRWRPWLQGRLAASRDTSIAASLGLRIPREAKARTSLSPRETEVHELLAQGLTNEEIAKLLYISLSTTKVHVKHIFEKLGVRSRLEAARALRGDV
jgi:DNA-binding NarL/FixJ family response regulator